MHSACESLYFLTSLYEHYLLVSDATHLFLSAVRNERSVFSNREIVPVRVSLLFIRLQTCIQIIPSLGLKDSLGQNTEGEMWSLQHI